MKKPPYINIATDHKIRYNVTGKEVFYEENTTDFVFTWTFYFRICS